MYVYIYILYYIYIILYNQLYMIWLCLKLIEHGHTSYPRMLENAIYGRGILEDSPVDLEYIHYCNLFLHIL